MFGGPLVDGEWLLDHLADVDVADVRWSVLSGPGRNDYEAAHLPGAVFVDLDVDLSDPPGDRGRHPLPPVSAFVAALDRLGLGRRPVVCYDDSGGAIAARLWWMLSILGFEAAVLDGGIRHWDGPVGSGPASARPASGHEAPLQPPSSSDNWPARSVVSVDQVLDRIAEGNVLLDARSAERFEGQPNPVDSRPGHVPGSLSRPWTANVGSDGLLLPPDQLRSQLADLGVNEQAAGWFASCGSGVTGCHNLLAAAVAGLPPGGLYVGSWSEWSLDPDRPIARS